MHAYDGNGWIGVLSPRRFARKTRESLDLHTPGQALFSGVQSGDGSIRLDSLRRVFALNGEMGISTDGTVAPMTAERVSRTSERRAASMRPAIGEGE